MSLDKEKHAKHSVNMTGKKSPLKGIKIGLQPWHNIDGIKNHRYITPKCSIPWNKGIENISWKGSNNPNWRGGVTKENDKIRKSIKYSQWRTSVFRRDNYTCVHCGECKSGKLNADHIKPFAYFPDLRFDIDNGRTLCIDCHKKTDTYLIKARWKHIKN